MKKYLKLSTLMILALSTGCEDIEVDAPGNNQSNESVAPKGTILWDETNVTLDNGKAKLPEMTAAGVTIGRLNATDENPDDEFDFQIKSQKVGGSDVNHFSIKKDSDSNYDLETNSNILDYEALEGSKEIIVTITVTDDNPDQKTSDFDVKVEISNVNEVPYFTNLDHVPLYADEHVEFNWTGPNWSNQIQWTDTDEGDNPTLTYTGSPSWLTITNEGQMSGTPTTSDVGINSWTLTLTDEGKDGDVKYAIQDLNITVRANEAPKFSNTNQIPTLIRVGCREDNENLVNLNWYDPNNNSANFAGDDLVTFTHQGTESVEWLNFDNEGAGILFCVRAPVNEDAGTSTIDLLLEDNRPNVPMTKEYSFDITVSANDEPEFNNLNNFPNTLAAGDTLTFDVNWQDPQDDQITFRVIESLPWFTWASNGDITAVPDSNDIGTYDLIFSIDDGCYPVTVEKSLTIE